jgi:hypothetical protein
VHYATARRGRFPRTTQDRPPVPKTTVSPGSESELSEIEADENVDEEEVVQPSTTTRLTAEKKCFYIAKEDVFTFSVWVEVDGQELKVYKTSEKGDIKEGYIASEIGKVC